MHVYQGRACLHTKRELSQSFYHTPRLTESVTKINLAYSNDCYTRFASPHNVQSRVGNLYRFGDTAASGVAGVLAGCRNGLFLAVPPYVERHC